jgi:hypothetical protein
MTALPPPDYYLPPQKKRKTALLISLLGAVVVIAALVTLVVILSSGSDEDETFTLRGTMAVTCSSSSYRSFSSSGCAAGYSDLHAGAQVEIYNEKQEILATGMLTSDAAPTVSTGSYSSLAVVTTYAFTIPDVPRGAKQYGVHVGNSNRGIIWAPEAQASTTGFTLSIGN